MGNIQSLRRRRSAGDPLRHDERTEAYLRSVRSSLQVPKATQRRVLEEIESHLDDGVAAHIRTGATPNEAIAMVIDELGPPDAIAASFNEEGTHGSDSASALRWLPVLLPTVLFMQAIGFLAWSITWISGGLTIGEKVAQRTYLTTALVTGTLACGAYFAITRARRDQAWRWAAWLCTGIALLVILAPRTL